MFLAYGEEKSCCLGLLNKIMKHSNDVSNGPSLMLVLVVNTLFVFERSLASLMEANCVNIMQDSQSEAGSETLVSYRRNVL